MKPRILSTARPTFPLATAIAALLATISTSTAAFTWDNTAGGAINDGAGAWLGTGLWNNSGSPSANWVSGSDAVFGNGGAGGAVTLASATAVNSITFNSFTGTYTLGSAASTITLANGITKNTGSGAATIISPITLGAAQSWTNNSAGLLTIGTGAVTNGGFLLTLGGTGNTTVSSIISGAGGLTKSDAGTATLSGANTYGGVTTINGGVLAVSTMANGGSTSAIGNSTNAAANLVFGSPTATLRYTGTGHSTNRGFTLSSGAGGGATIEASGTGALSFDNTVAIAYGTANETRTLTLGGTNTTNENVFGKSLADNGSGATSLVKAGAATWVLSATNTYGGGTSVNTGSLVFRTLAAKSGTGTHAFGAGTTIGLGVGGSNFTTTDVDNAFSSITGHSALAGNLSNVTLTSTTNVGIDTTAGNLAYSTNVGSVTKGLVKYGTNTLTLGANNAYTGATTVVGGTLSVGTLANAGSNSSIGNFATAGATGLILTGGKFNYTGVSTTTDRGFTATGGLVKTISVGTGVNLGLGASVKNETASSTSGLTFSASGAGSSITISSMTITSGSSADFNLVGSFNPNVTIQNLNVTGANVIHERTGTYILNVGNINGTGASGWFGNMNITGVISGYTGAITLGGNTTFSGLSTFDTTVTAQQSSIYSFNTIKNVGGGASALGAPTTVANGTIGFGNGGNTPTFRYTGTGDTTNRVLDLRGSGTLNLEQAGTGLLKFTANTTANTGNTGAKTLNFTGSTAGTGEFAGAIVEHTVTNKTSVSKSGSGIWTLSGVNVYTGTTAVNGGTLIINGNQEAATGAVTVAAGTTNATAVRLKGTGTVGGHTSFTADPDGAGTQVGGIHSPGNSVGKQSFDQAGVAVTNLTYNSGSIFEWELANVPAETAISVDLPGAYASNRGTAYDAVNVTGTLGGSDAIFRVVLDGSQTFADSFWTANRSWTDIFRTGDGTGTGNLDYASIFGGGFQYYNYSGAGSTLTALSTPTAFGSFSITGSTLTWSAVPEPTSALVGLLIGAGLLRRRRSA